MLDVNICLSRALPGNLCSPVHDVELVDPAWQGHFWFIDNSACNNDYLTTWEFVLPCSLCFHTFMHCLIHLWALRVICVSVSGNGCLEVVIKNTLCSNLWWNGKLSDFTCLKRCCIFWFHMKASKKLVVRCKVTLLFVVKSFFKSIFGICKVSSIFKDKSARLGPLVFWLCPYPHLTWHEDSKHLKWRPLSRSSKLICSLTLRNGWTNKKFSFC